MKYTALPFLALISLIFSNFVSLKAWATTPSHVFQQVEIVIADIQSIRQHQAIDRQVREPGIQIAKTPLHVYTKGMEVFEKIIRYQSDNNWPQSRLPPLPNKNVTPADVLTLVNNIQQALIQIKQKLPISKQHHAPLPEGKTPSDVYERMWQASYLMDDLAGAISPKLVLRNSQRIYTGLQRIAVKMNKNISSIPMEPTTAKQPVDANIEGFKVLFLIAKLEKQLGIPPLRVPGFPAGDIIPSDVYDTTNNIIAELTRINIHLQIEPLAEQELPAGKITPSHVVAQMQAIQQLLTQLLR